MGKGRVAEAALARGGFPNVKTNTPIGTTVLGLPVPGCTTPRYVDVRSMLPYIGWYY